MFLSSQQTLQLSCLDNEIVDRIKSSNVFLVGAGGIGCEVLKGLLLTGFTRITLIDLDTIDVSNLNRQFLYTKNHVGKSKAEVAAQISVERFSHRDENGKPISEVIPIHDSVLNLKYDHKFYRQFTFVINALDNNATRVHVNRLCLASDLPLIESGSGGYFGNVTLIKGGVTKCFECDPPKKDETSYAFCTIRQTPSQPIHCIVWAKDLFAQLFGQYDEDISPDATVLSSSELDPEQETLNNQTTRQYFESIDYDPKAFFDKIFYHDILYLKSMKKTWENRRAPQEILYEKILNGELCFQDTPSNSMESNKITDHTNGSSDNSNPKIIADHKLWSMQECLKVFISSLAELKERLKKDKCLEWDKDDDVIVDFVASVANFRCHCFYIPRKSKFEIKSLAGNIIPAISSTNTIVGGYVLFQAIRLLKSLLPERFAKKTTKTAATANNKLTEEDIKKESESILKNGFRVFITNKNLPNLSKIAIEPLPKPKPDCIVCSEQIKEIVIELPFNRISLAYLVEQIAIRRLNTVAPDINCYDLKKMFYAADDSEELKQPNSYYHTTFLSSFDYFVDNILLNVKDLEQHFSVDIRFRNVEITPEEEEANDGELFRIVDPEELSFITNKRQKRKLEEEPQNGDSQSSMVSMDDDSITTDNDSAKTQTSLKRKHNTVQDNDNIPSIHIIDDHEDLICLNDNEPSQSSSLTKRMKIN